MVSSFCTLTASFVYLLSYVYKLTNVLLFQAVVAILKNIKNIVSLLMRGQIVDSEHEIVFEMVLLLLLS